MCAIVAVARKLAAILHRMWINGSEFQWTAGAKVAEKVKCICAGRAPGRTARQGMSAVLSAPPGDGTRAP